MGLGSGLGMLSFPVGISGEDLGRKLNYWCDSDTWYHDITPTPCRAERVGAADAGSVVQRPKDATTTARLPPQGGGKKDLN